MRSLSKTLFLREFVKGFVNLTNHRKLIVSFPLKNGPFCPRRKWIIWTNHWIFMAELAISFREGNCFGWLTCGFWNKNALKQFNTVLGCGFYSWFPTIYQGHPFMTLVNASEQLKMNLGRIHMINLDLGVERLRKVSIAILLYYLVGDWLANLFYEKNLLTKYTNRHLQWHFANSSVPPWTGKAGKDSGWQFPPKRILLPLTAM